MRVDLLKPVGALGYYTGSATLALVPTNRSLSKATKHEEAEDFIAVKEIYQSAIDNLLKQNHVKEHKDLTKPCINRALAKLYFKLADALCAQGDFEGASQHYENAYQCITKASSSSTKGYKARTWLAIIGSGYSNFLALKEQAEKIKNQPVNHTNVVLSNPTNDKTIAQAAGRNPDKVLEETAEGFIKSPADSTHKSNFFRNHFPFRDIPFINRSASPGQVKNSAFDIYLNELKRDDAQPYFAEQRISYGSSSPSDIVPQQGEPIEDIHYLISLKKNGSSSAQQNQYIRTIGMAKLDSLTRVQESIALVSLNDATLNLHIINRFLDELKAGKFHVTPIYILCGLSAMLLRLNELDRTNKNTVALEEEGCNKALRALIPLLKTIQIRHNLEGVRALLQSLSLVLDLMGHYGFGEIDQKDIKTPLLKALKKFRDCPYPELNWLAEYIEAALKSVSGDVPDAENVREGLKNSAFGLFYTAVYFAKVITTNGATVIIAGDSLASAWGKFAQAYDAISWLKGPPEWYKDLCFIDMMIDLGRLDIVGQFLHSSPRVNALGFLQGLCDRLERLVFIKTNDLEADRRIRNDALMLLQDFKQQGKDSQSDKLSRAPNPNDHKSHSWAGDNAKNRKSLSQYAAQTLQNIARVWPEPDINAMEESGYAPHPLHSFWTKPSRDPLSYPLLKQLRKNDAHLEELSAIYQYIKKHSNNQAQGSSSSPHPSPLSPA